MSHHPILISFCGGECTFDANCQLFFSSTQVTFEKDNEELEPLRGFVSVMAGRFPDPLIMKEFKAINDVLNPDSSSPQDVTDALHFLKTEASAERNILASFKSIQQGKKIMVMTEDKIDSKAHLLKVASDLKGISSRCDSYAIAAPSNKLEDSLRYFSSEAASIRSAAGKVAADDQGGKSALEEARASLTGFANALLTSHCLSEAGPWLQTQCKTLSASKVISKVPGFAVLNINDIYEKATGTRLTQMDDLVAFYHATSDIASETDSLLRITDTDEEHTAKLRSASVQLCQAFKKWSTQLMKVSCSCPPLANFAEQLNCELKTFVASTCTLVWKSAIALPKQLFREIVLDSGHDRDDAEMKLISDAISDAKLLATSPQDPEHRDQFLMVTSVLEDFVTAVTAAVKAGTTKDLQYTCKCLSILFNRFKKSGILPENSVLSKDTLSKAVLDPVVPLGYILCTPMLIHHKVSPF